MNRNKDVRKSKYTYANRFVIRETLANYQYSDDIISFMLKETKINENLFSLLKYYQTDALSFLQLKTGKLLRYHVFCEIYNVYLFHNDIKGLFKRAKIDMLKQFEVRRVLLLCEYSFVTRYINKEEDKGSTPLSSLLNANEKVDLNLNNVHLLHELDEELLMNIKHDIMSFNKTLSIKDVNNTLYYYFEHQIVGMLRETWDKTLFELFIRVFDDYCASKHKRNKYCNRYFRKKLCFINCTKYLEKVCYQDIKFIRKYLKLKRVHREIIVRKEMNPNEVLSYYYKYKKTDVLIFFAERKYDQKIYSLIEELGIQTEITSKIKNNQEKKDTLIFSRSKLGIHRKNVIAKKDKVREHYFFI